MIELIHRYPILIKTLLALVTVTFVVTGGWIMGKEGLTDYAAKVDGQRISVKEYQDGVQRLQEFYSKMNLPADFMQKMDLNKRALDSLIEKKLVLLAAKKENITVSDDEVSQAIKENKNFADESGKFSKSRYEELLKYNRMTPAAFEQALREDQVAEKFKKMIKDSVYVSDAEVKDYYMGQMKAQGKEFKEDEFATRKDEMKRSLLSTRQEQAVASMVEGLRAASKVEINKDVVGAPATAPS